MGYILPEIYQSLCREHNKSLPTIFIETGTFKGGVPHRMLDMFGTLDPFQKIYTIELGEKICRIASERFRLFETLGSKISETDKQTEQEDVSFQQSKQYFNERLSLMQGDSAEILEKILTDINKPVCFWLDAHAGSSKYARGREDVPLLRELEVISKHPVKNHIIAIDDAHLFGKLQFDTNGAVVCDYSKIHYKFIKEKLLQINPSYDIGVYAPYDMPMVLAI